MRTWPHGAFPRWDSWKALDVPRVAPFSHHHSQGTQGPKRSAEVRGCQAGRVLILKDLS